MNTTVHGQLRKGLTGLKGFKGHAKNQMSLKVPGNGNGVSDKIRNNNSIKDAIKFELLNVLPQIIVKQTALSPSPHLNYG
jgi:hypothetical protein